MSYNNNPIDDSEKIVDFVKALKEEANNLLSDKENTSNISQAISLYEKGLDSASAYIYSSRKKDKKNLDVVMKLKLLTKQMMSNLSLCYYRQNNFDKSIEIDKGIITIDPFFDKAYARLFSCFNKKNQSEIAVEYGRYLVKNFNEETLSKYPSIRRELEECEKKVKEKKEAEYEKEKKEFHEKIFKMYVPIIV